MKPDVATCQGARFLPYGLVIGLETEFGYISLKEIEAIRGPAGLRIERDLWFRPTPVRELPEYKACWGNGGPYPGGTSVPDQPPDFPSPPEPGSVAVSPNPESNPDRKRQDLAVTRSTFSIPPRICDSDLTFSHQRHNVCALAGAESWHGARGTNGASLSQELPGGWTNEDIRFLLDKLVEGPILVAQTRLGIPTIHDNFGAETRHLGFGLMQVEGDGYTLRFDAGGAMHRTPSGQGWTKLIIEGEYDGYDRDAVQQTLSGWLVPDSRREKIRS